MDDAERRAPHQGDAGERTAGGDATRGFGGSGQERLVQEGLDHLQQAVRETIAAVRSLLDVAEELVEDPRAAETLASTVGSFAEAARRSMPLGQAFGRRAPRSTGDDRRGAGTGTGSGVGCDDDDGDDTGGVQRIPVS